MNSIEVLITGLGLTFIVYYTFYIWIDRQILPNVKPFNCQFCLSFWVCVLFYLITFNPVSIAIPLMFSKIPNKIKEYIIKRYEARK